MPVCGLFELELEKSRSGMMANEPSHDAASTWNETPVSTAGMQLVHAILMLLIKCRPRSALNFVVLVLKRIE